MCLIMCGSTVPCMQEMYREMLTSEEKLQKRFIFLGQQKRITNIKMLEKLDQGKAASIVCTCSCCINVPLAGCPRSCFVRFWEAP